MKGNRGSMQCNLKKRGRFLKCKKFLPLPELRFPTSIIFDIDIVSQALIFALTFYVRK